MIQKIRHSLLLQLICIVLAILIILSGTLYASFLYVRQTTQNYAETLAESLLKQADNAISLYEENLRYNAEFLCRFMVLDSFEEDDKEVREARISSDYTQVALKNREIVSAILYDNDMNVVLTLGRPVSLPSGRAYLRQSEDMTGGRYYGEDDDFYYAFYYPVYSGVASQREQIGMCVFIMEHWKLDGNLHNIFNESTAAMLLSDSNNLDLAYRAFGDIPQGVTMKDLKYNEDYVYREGNWQNGIRIAVAVAVAGNTAGSNVISRLILLASVIIFIFLAIIVLFSYFRMAKPIAGIDRFIRHTIKNPEKRLNLKRTDEIGNVASSLDRMLDENQRMIEEIKDGKIRLYETELVQQKLEILAYRNQINPHFLYNTLSCIRDMALINDEDNIAEVAMALSDIFRYAVKGSNIVTVRDEVSYIEKYARIIDYRFMGKIKITVDVEEEALDKNMIRFFLQPLVENSVFHGLESKIEDGNVAVSIKTINNRLEMVVEDDGIGMDEETLDKLKSEIENPRENKGIGLANIVQRLRLFYDDDYTIVAESEVDKGTTIKISVPEHMKES
jgi:two-component system sensor histidine kinase YesM